MTETIEWVTPRPANWDVMTEEQQEAAMNLQRRFYAAMHRTPEQIAEAQERALARMRPGRPLPPGKTLEDVFVGAIKDDMTDEEVVRALEELDD